MDKEHSRRFITLVEEKIKNSAMAASKFDSDNSSECMDIVGDNIDKIYSEFDKYIITSIRSKNESLVHLIKFMSSYFPKLTNLEIQSMGNIKSDTQKNAKNYQIMLKELVQIYIYIPCADIIQKKMFKRAAEYVINRDTKRLKSE